MSQQRKRSVFLNEERDRGLGGYSVRRRLGVERLVDEDLRFKFRPGYGPGTRSSCLFSCDDRDLDMKVVCNTAGLRHESYSSACARSVEGSHASFAHHAPCETIDRSHGSKIIRLPHSMKLEG